VALVVCGHAVVLALLVIHRGAESDLPADQYMTLTFIDPLRETARSSPSNRPMRPPRSLRTPIESLAPASDTTRSAVITPGIDWYANGSAAARRAAAEPTTRDFGFPGREPAKRERKPFGWDKTHTERVHALEGGGIGIHLSDNCELILVPLPLAGCALGKRKARGDLFDEMQEPPQMGDWK
jgi:hypothetical protein